MKHNRRFIRRIAQYLSWYHGFKRR